MKQIFLSFITLILFSELKAEEKCSFSKDQLKKLYNISNENFGKVNPAWYQIIGVNWGCYRALRESAENNLAIVETKLNNNIEDKTLCEFVVKRLSEVNTRINQLEQVKAGGCVEGCTNTHCNLLDKKKFEKTKFDEYTKKHKNDPLPAIAIPQSISSQKKSQLKLSKILPDEIAKKAVKDAWTIFDNQSIALKQWQKSSALKYKNDKKSQQKIVDAFTKENQDRQKVKPDLSSHTLYTIQRDRFARYLLNTFNPSSEIDLETESSNLEKIKNHLNKDNKKHRQIITDGNYSGEEQVNLNALSLPLIEYKDIVSSKQLRVGADATIKPAKTASVSDLSFVLNLAIKNSLENKSAPLKIKDFGAFAIEYEAAIAAEHKAPISEKAYKMAQRLWKKNSKNFKIQNSDTFHHLYKKAQKELSEVSNANGLTGLLLYQEINSESLLKFMHAHLSTLPEEIREKFLIKLIPNENGKFEMQLVEYDKDRKKYKNLGDKNWQDLKDQVFYKSEMYYLLELRKQGLGQEYNFSDLEVVRGEVTKKEEVDCVDCSKKKTDVVSADILMLRMTIDAAMEELDSRDKITSKKKKPKKHNLSIGDIFELATLIPKDISIKDVLSILSDLDKAKNLVEALKFVKENKDSLKDLTNIKNNLPKDLNLAQAIALAQKTAPRRMTSPTEIRNAISQIKSDPQILNTQNASQLANAPTSKPYRITLKDGQVLESYNQDWLNDFKMKDDLEPKSGSLSMFKKTAEREFLSDKMKFSDGMECDNSFDFWISSFWGNSNNSVTKNIYFRNDKYFEEYKKLKTRADVNDYLISLIDRHNTSCWAKADLNFFEEYLKDPFSYSAQKSEMVLNRLMNLDINMKNKLYSNYGMKEIEDSVTFAERYAHINCSGLGARVEYFRQRIKQVKESYNFEYMKGQLKNGSYSSARTVWSNLESIEKIFQDCVVDVSNGTLVNNSDPPWEKFARESVYDRGALARSKVSAQRPSKASEKKDLQSDELIPITILPPTIKPGENFDNNKTGRENKSASVNDKAVPNEEIFPLSSIPVRSVVGTPFIGNHKYILPPKEWYLISNQINLSDLNPNDIEMIKKWGPGIFLYYYRYNQENPNTPLGAMNHGSFQAILNYRKMADKIKKESLIELPPLPVTSSFRINSDFYSVLKDEKEIPLDMALYLCSALTLTRDGAKRSLNTDQQEFINELRKRVLAKLSKY